MIMYKISVYFRDDLQCWETKNLSYDPALFGKSKQRKLIEIGCNFEVFGNSLIGKSIDRFLSNELMKEYRFDCTGAERYFYVIRREEV